MGSQNSSDTDTRTRTFAFELWEQAGKPDGCPKQNQVC